MLIKLLSNIIILAIAIAFSIWWFYLAKPKEEFQSGLLNDRDSRRSGQASLTPYTTIANHMRLNRFDRPDEISTKPITPRPGETKCSVASCPNYISKDTTCYKCN